MTNEERELLRPLIESIFKENNRDFTDQMLEDTLKKIDQLSSETPKMLYAYKHPDYKKMMKPLPEALAPLTKNDDDKNSVADYEEFIDYCSSLDRNTLVEAVNSLIYDCLDKWHNVNEDDDDEEGIWMYPLHVAVMIIERFKLRECLPVLLEIERQDRDFAETYFDECDLTGMVPACIYQIITEDDLPILAVFMREQGIYSFIKAEVSAAVSTLPRRLPQTLPAVQKWLCELLEIFADSIDPSIGDVMLLEAIIHCCIHTHCEAAKPMIIRMYSKYKMPNILVSGGVNEVRKTIKRAKIGVLKEDFESAETIYLNADNIYNSDVDFDDEFDDDFDEEFDEDEYFDDFEEIDDKDNEDEDYDEEELAPRQKYCGWAMGGKARYQSVKVVKKYTLHIELEHSSPLIWRELEVPSSLCLTSLAQAILLAMGWDEDHLHQFLSKGKNNNHYATSQNELSSSLYPGTKDGSLYGVSHILMKPGDSVTFEYDYGDSWHHTVTLLKVTEYTSNEPKSVILSGGANACPPDDCGGIYAYQHLLKLMKNKPKSVELNEFYEWMGCKWDPEYFPLEKAAKAVAQMNPSTHKRK